MSATKSPGTTGGEGFATVTHMEPAEASFADKDYIDWHSIFAGTVVALAVGFVLLTFGSAVGLAVVSPWSSTRTTAVAVSLGAAFWMILVQVWSFALGGYLAARMRHRQSGATQAEVTFRDGAHGAAVWGLAITFGAVIAALITVSAMRSDSDSLSLSRVSDPVTVATDTLLRTTRASTSGQSEDLRGTISRILYRSAGATPMTAEDRAYLTEFVVSRTGVAAPEADKRITDAVAQMKAALNKARKAGVVTGFMVAASLLLGAAAAWWGASVGGRHRDESTIWSGFARYEGARSAWIKP